jgi:hypothetical protein
MPWDEDEIKKNIGISLISERYIMYIARWIMNRFPKFYNFLKKIYFALRK